METALASMLRSNQSAWIPKESDLGITKTQLADCIEAYATSTGSDLSIEVSRITMTDSQRHVPSFAI